MRNLLTNKLISETGEITKDLTVNNDLQVKLKGSKEFMDEDHRVEIVNNLKSTDMGVLSIDNSPSVAQTIGLIRSLFPEEYNTFTFYNSGDRNPNTTNSKEDLICMQLGIKTKFLDLPKIYSSSELKNSVY